MFRHHLGSWLEWIKAAVLKTAESRGSVGSNPTLPASFMWISGSSGLRRETVNLVPFGESVVRIHPGPPHT